MPEYAPDYVPEHRVFTGTHPDKELSENLTDKMIRRPTEEDFEDVLTPEGFSEGTTGSDVSDGTYPGNTSIAGTG